MIEQEVVGTSQRCCHLEKLRMDEKEGISAEEQARRRLRSKQPAGRSLTDHETVSKRLKREATIAAIKQEILKTFTERPEFGTSTQASEH